MSHLTLTPENAQRPAQRPNRLTLTKHHTGCKEGRMLHQDNLIERLGRSRWGAATYQETRLRVVRDSEPAHGIITCHGVHTDQHRTLRAWKGGWDTRNTTKNAESVVDGVSVTYHGHQYAVRGQ